MSDVRTLLPRESSVNALESQGGPQKGIKVYVHWTIEVRDPDGKLAAHREFENALEPSGAEHL